MPFCQLNHVHDIDLILAKALSSHTLPTRNPKERESEEEERCQEEEELGGVACERSGQPAPSHYSSPAVAPIPSFTHKFSGKNSRPAKSVPHSRQRQKRAAQERERDGQAVQGSVAKPKSEKAERQETTNVL